MKGTTAKEKEGKVMPHRVFLSQTFILLTLISVGVLISCDNSVTTEETSETTVYGKVPEALTIDHLDIVFNQVKDITSHTNE